MGVYSTPAQLVRAQEARLRAVMRSVPALTKELAEMAKEDMIEQTQGPLKSKTLRAMGHPYARKGAMVAGAARGITGKKVFTSPLKGQITKSGMVQRLPINLQSGRLHNRIRLDQTKRSPTDPRFALYTDVPYGKDVLSVKGTDRMVPRGLLGPAGLLRKRHKLRKHVAFSRLQQAHRQVP